MNKKQIAKTEKTSQAVHLDAKKLRNYQAATMIAVCCVLTFSALAHTLQFATKPIQTTAVPFYNPNNSDPQNDDSTEIKSLSAGTAIDKQSKVSSPSMYFASSDKNIYVSAKLQNPKAGQKIKCAFYYLGNNTPKESTCPVELRLHDSEIVLSSASQEHVGFELKRPGINWQLKGLFKAEVSSPSNAAGKSFESDKEEIIFTIY